MNNSVPLITSSKSSVGRVSSLTEKSNQLYVSHIQNCKYVSHRHCGLVGYNLQEISSIR
jgi:hypothetical protein